MALTQTDLDKLDALIRSVTDDGAQTVRYSDGREVTYYSLSEMVKARNAIQAAIAGAAGGVRCTYMKYSKD